MCYDNYMDNCCSQRPIADAATTPAPARPFTRHMSSSVTHRGWAPERTLQIVSPPATTPRLLSLHGLANPRQHPPASAVLTRLCGGARPGAKGCLGCPLEPTMPSLALMCKWDQLLTPMTQHLILQVTSLCSARAEAMVAIGQARVVSMRIEEALHASPLVQPTGTGAAAKVTSHEARLLQRSG